MNTPTPTPRTDAAWASSFEPCEYRAAHTARTMRDECERLETELAALTAERDHWQKIAVSASREREHNANVAQAMTAERNQLRAELALLREWQREVIQNANAHHAERKDAIARAESAEREAFDWKKIARYEAARAERAEAELAAERARLDWLQAQEVKRGLEITEGHDDPLPFLVLDEDGTTHWGDTYRAAIDAAMKEGAK